MTDRSQRIAAIDIGTNSIHMIVVETKDRNVRVIDREKDMVQLGLSSLDGQPLTDEAIARGVASITRMAEIAARWKVSEIVAVATSAVREAPNRRDFLTRVREASGVKIRVISGEEEADLIFRAIRTAVDLDGSTALAVDIGGGSVELIVGTEEEIFFAASEPLGSLRMSQRFSLQNKPLKRSMRACRAFASEHLSKHRKRVGKLGVDLCVGTSGTILALAALSPAGEPTESGSSGLKVLERARLRDAIEQLSSMTAKERVKAFGLDEKRASTILAGALVLDEVFAAFGVESLVASPVAMREGIIDSRVSELSSDRKNGGSLRRRSVLALARRTDCDLKHGAHVSRLATRIFDQTRALHCLPDESRELLHYAALVHESGLHISDRGHHKHSYYLIRHADLKGFTEDELLIVANVARYFRGAPPRDDHANLVELSPTQRADVEKLASILRIAEGLDRGNRQRVRDVAVRVSRETVRFLVRNRSNASVEIGSARKRARYFADMFSVRVRFDTV